MKGNGVGPGGIFPESFLCFQTDIKTRTTRKASTVTRSSPEASMVAMSVTDRQMVMAELVCFIYPEAEGWVAFGLDYVIVSFHLQTTPPSCTKFGT